MGNYLAELVKDATLTKSQKKIAEYFIQNQNAICNLSSLEVAGEIGVSDASIIRFSRAIGFEGYSDLKDHVYAELVAGNAGPLSLSERLSQNQEKYNGLDVAGFLQIAQENIGRAFTDNRAEDMEAIADAVIGANQRYVIGLRGLRGIALKFGRLLSFMLSGVHTLTDGECISIHNLQDITDRDVLVMFVFSRFYKIDLSYIRMAKERGTKVALIVNEMTSPLTPYADWVLLVPGANSSFYHSTIAADLIAEYILNRISTKADFRERIDEQDAITSDQRL